MTFQIGDTVKFKSGGPVMTVAATDAGEKGDQIRCEWFDTEGKPQHKLCVPDVLKPAVPPDEEEPPGMIVG